MIKETEQSDKEIFQTTTEHDQKQKVDHSSGTHDQ